MNWFDRDNYKFDSKNYSDFVKERREVNNGIKPTVETTEEFSTELYDEFGLDGNIYDGIDNHGEFSTELLYNEMEFDDTKRSNIIIGILATGIALISIFFYSSLPLIIFGLILGIFSIASKNKTVGTLIVLLNTLSLVLYIFSYRLF